MMMMEVRLTSEKERPVEGGVFFGWNWEYQNTAVGGGRSLRP
jgi:hypothetical protein